MTPLHYTISADIFRKFPGYRRGVVLATNVRNGESSAELVGLLRQAEESVRARLNLETLAEQPAFKSWREAFRAFGAKPADFRPSIEAMARRVLRGDPLPSINTIVDIGNVISLRYLLPAGAHAIDRLTGDIQLRLADGSEDFVALGSQAGQAPEHPLPGEVIFAEGSTVLTRRWVWRQGSHTLALPESTAIEFNIDGLPPTSPEDVEQAGQATAALISQFCGGQMKWEVLSEDHPRMQLISKIHHKGTKLTKSTKKRKLKKRIMDRSPGITETQKRANLLSNQIIAAAIEVHRALGPGLLESAYESCMCQELGLRNISFKRQVPISIEYKGLKLDCAYRIDLLIENLVVVELKVVDNLLPIHEAQLLTYLKLTHLWLGMLINFDTPLVKTGIKRIVNGPGN